MLVFPILLSLFTFSIAPFTFYHIIKLSYFNLFTQKNYSLIKWSLTLIQHLYKVGIIHPYLKNESTKVRNVTWNNIISYINELLLWLQISAMKEFLPQSWGTKTNTKALKKYLLPHEVYTNNLSGRSWTYFSFLKSYYQNYFTKHSTL